MSAIPRPFVILPSNRPGDGTFLGLNSQTIVGNSAGAWTITANGTNQNVAVVPSGTGIFTVAVPSATAGTIGSFARNSTTLGFTAPAGVGGVGTISNHPLVFLTNNAERFRVVSTGNVLLGGLTTDGTGVLQFPAAITNAGGLNFGTEIFFFRTGTNTAQISASAGLALTGKISSYNGVATAGWGTVAVQADSTIAGTSNARAAAVASYTVGAADGTFIVSGNVNVTVSTTHSFSLDVSYTDETNVARVLVLPIAQLAGAFVASGLITNVTGAGPYEAASMTIRCKASTSIVIRVSSGGTYTTVTYNSTGNIRQVG